MLTSFILYTLQDHENLNIQGNSPYPPRKSSVNASHKPPSHQQSHAMPLAQEDGDLYPLEENSLDMTDSADDLNREALPTLEERLRREASLLSDQYSGDG